ncbi:MAG: EamA family transporter [archaeon]
MRAFRSIIVAVLLMATAQLLMKRGVSGLTINLSNISSLIFNPYLVLGLLSLFVGTVIYLSALSKSDLSYAYPILSLGYIFVAFASMFFLGEHLSLVRWAGILTVCFGVFLMSRS